jgi:hypothetical protein
MVPILLLIICAVTTATTSVLCAVVIEKYGGVIGGIISTLPMTIVPYSVGYVVAHSPETYSDSDTESATMIALDEVDKTMYSVPIGIFTNMIYLFAWRTLPTLDCFGGFRMRFSHTRQLLYLLPLALSSWFLAAAAFIFSLNCYDDLSSRRIIGVSFVSGSLVFGFSILFLRPIASPAASTMSPYYVNIARAIFSGCSIVASLYISDWNAEVSGVTSVFPAVFTITIVSLWISHGQGVPHGALGPMILGTICVDAYTISFAQLHPYLYRNLEVTWLECAIITAAISWVIAVTGWSLPIFCFIRWWRRRIQQQQTDETNLSKPFLADIDVDEYSIAYIKGAEKFGINT